MALRQKYPWDINSSGLTGDPTLSALGIDTMNPAPSQEQASNLDASQTPSAAMPTIPAPQKQALLNENLGPVKRGINKSDELKNDGTTKTLNQFNTLYTPEQLAATTKSWADLPQFQQQQQDIDKQKGLLAMMQNQPMQKDLSPMLSLIDSFTGSKLAQSYTKPQNPLQNMSSLFGYNNKLAGDQSQLNNNIIKAFGDSRSGMSTQLQQLMQTEILKNAVGMGNQRPNNFGATNFNAYQNAVAKEMGGEKATNEASELKGLNDLVAQNSNPTALKELPIRLDKFLTGSARVSDSQIKMLGGDPSVLNSLEQKLRAALGPDAFDDKGYLTAKNRAEYLDLFQQYAGERNKMSALKAQWLRSPNQLKLRGLPPEAGQAALPDSMVNIFSLPANAAAPAAGGPVDPDAQLKAAILKHLQDKQSKGK